MTIGDLDWSGKGEDPGEKGGRGDERDFGPPRSAKFGRRYEPK